MAARPSATPCTSPRAATCWRRPYRMVRADRLSVERTPFEVPTAGPGIALSSLAIVRRTEVLVEEMPTGDPLRVGRVRVAPELGPSELSSKEPRADVLLDRLSGAGARAGRDRPRVPPPRQGRRARRACAPRRRRLRPHPLHRPSPPWRSRARGLRDGRSRPAGINHGRGEHVLRDPASPSAGARWWPPRGDRRSRGRRGARKGGALRGRVRNEISRPRRRGGLPAAGRGPPSQACPAAPTGPMGGHAEHTGRPRLRAPPWRHLGQLSRRVRGGWPEGARPRRPSREALRHEPGTSPGAGAHHPSGKRPLQHRWPAQHQPSDLAPAIPPSEEPRQDSRSSEGATEASPESTRWRSSSRRPRGRPS